MSTETRRPVGRVLLGNTISFRALAYLSAVVLSVSYLWVLGHVVDVVGGQSGLTVFALEVLGTLALAGALARVLTVGRAVALGVALLAVGLLGYLATVPAALIDVGRQVGDTIALLTGLSVLRMTNAGVWALGFTPAPVFVSWYFYLRREWALGTLVGGAALGFFVLTSDAGTLLALAGVVGAAGVLGFGRLDREGGSVPQRNTLVAVLVAMLVVTTSISLVPGGEAQPLLPDRQTATVESSLVNAGSRLSVLGSISLSPTVRFTVTADESDYWRVGAYDRYTGGGWVRTGETTRYDGALPSPDGDAAALRQTYRVESPVAVMPAAWKPTRVGRVADRTRVTSTGDLQPVGGFDEGDGYTVLSRTPQAAAGDLRRAGTDYPDEVAARYLQVPESTPGRVATFTDRLTENASTPYDTAVLIERWLEANKRYSLDVKRPEGDIASSFLFDMEAGYCTYYATTMAVMLRSQDVPARFVVGYTPGQRVDEDRWVVRGLDAHAWVEVYFPGEGWIRFDPTPAAPRMAAERGRLNQAREANEPDVDTNLSEGNPYTPAEEDEEESSSTDPSAASAEIEQVDLNGTTPQIGLLFEPVSTDPTDTGPPLPTREVILYGVILLAGLAVTIERTGIHSRAYRAIWLRWTPRGPPGRRVQAAYDRLEYLLSRRYRPRRADETPREYIEALSPLGLDDRVHRLYDLYERARYAGHATEDEATLARELIDGLR